MAKSIWKGLGWDEYIIFLGESQQSTCINSGDGIKCVYLLSGCPSGGI